MLLLINDFMFDSHLQILLHFFENIKKMKSVNLVFLFH